MNKLLVLVVMFMVGCGDDQAMTCAPTGIEPNVCTSDYGSGAYQVTCYVEDSSLHSAHPIPGADYGTCHPIAVIGHKDEYNFCCEGK